MKPSKPRPLTRAELNKFPLPSVEEGDKNSRGRLLIVAGGRELPGPPVLTALAAMRTGVGKTMIATVESAARAIGVASPESRVVGLEEARDGGFTRGGVAKACDLTAHVDAVVAGPGMLPSRNGARLAAGLCASGITLALDAGLLKDLPERGRQARGAAAPLLLLPHKEEMAELIGCEPEDVDDAPLECGRLCAERYDAIVLVKGAESHVVATDGRSWKYRGGGPGLGISGSGDNLAGILGALLARGAEPVAALLWAVWLHGEAGAALAKTIGPIGFLAREIADQIPALLPR